MPKMHQHTFSGLAPPVPAWGAYVIPQSPKPQCGLLLMGREEGMGEEGKENFKTDGWSRV